MASVLAVAMEKLQAQFRGCMVVATHAFSRADAQLWDAHCSVQPGECWSFKEGDVFVVRGWEDYWLRVSLVPPPPGSLFVAHSGWVSPDYFKFVDAEEYSCPAQLFNPAGQPSCPAQTVESPPPPPPPPLAALSPLVLSPFGLPSVARSGWVPPGYFKFADAEEYSCPAQLPSPAAQPSCPAQAAKPPPPPPPPPLAPRSPSSSSAESATAQGDQG